ncbi:MAG: NAD(P)-dependent oxidoreductase [Pseudomonadales bacterium]|nr:NAD(P)-dependent oxidoreductase [Pseudomonadales bacterium]
MKVLITGATGFVGKSYAMHLLQREDVEVYGSGRQAQKGEALRQRGVHFFCGDLLDVPYVEHMCKQMDVVIHCAGKSGVWGDFETYYNANVVPTENLIQACQKSGVSRLVFLGTPSIYFDHRDHINISEDYLPRRFVDNYARTKYQAECKALEAHSDQFGVVSLRPRLVVGKGDTSFLPRIIEAHQEGKLKRIGTGRNVISVTSADNLMQALDCCVFGPETGLGTAYNIADAEPVKIWSVIDELFSILNMPKVEQQVPYWLAAGAAEVVESSFKLLRRNQEPPLLKTKISVMAKSFTLNIEKARRQLAYRPKNNFQESLIQFAHDWQQNLPAK